HPACPGAHSSENNRASTYTNTPIANATPKKMIRWNSVRARGPITSAATSPTDNPRVRADSTSAEKSWTQPTKIAPRTTQHTAGNQPQSTATAGPKIGRAHV